jgi:cell division protein FtsZ
MMQMGGGSLLSIGYGEGPNKAMQAVEKALHHPLLDSIPLTRLPVLSPISPAAKI